MKHSKCIVSFITILFLMSIFMPTAKATIDTTESEEKQSETSTISTNKEEQSKPVNINSAKKLVKDGGIYKIKASVGSNMYLDIDEGKTTSGANLQIWSKSDVPQQKFQINDIGNGYYKMTVLHSKNVIDVDNAGKTNGTNVQQWSPNNTDAQQWIIQDAGNGYCNIISKCNGLYLDVNGAYSSNGTNVQMYEGNGTNAQKFKFEEVVQPQPKHTKDDGVYKIKAKVGSNMCLDIDGGKIASGANLQIWSTDNVNQQKFQINDIGNGYYKITVLHSGNVLDVNNAGKTNGTNVQQWSSNNTDAQQWIIQDAGDDYFNIISKCNGLYLDVNGGYSSNGTNVQMYEENGTNAQKFKFEKVEKVEATYTVESDTYKISTALNENKVLDISDGSTAEGRNLQIWENSNVAQQIFSVKRIENGFYEIEIPFSKRVVDVDNAGTTNGTNVHQWSSNNTDAQKWIIKKAEDVEGDYYYIISKNSQLYLDVANNNAANGTNIQIHEKKEGKSQLFKFTKYEKEKSPILYDGTYRIASAIQTRDNLALDIDGGKRTSKANLQIWGSTNVLQQKFKLTHIGNNIYTIVATHSNMALEVANNGMKKETNVWQNTLNANSKAQQWIIEKEGNSDYYRLKSVLNGLYLDVAGGEEAARNGTNVWVYEKNSTKAQLFKLEEIYFGIDVSEHQHDINFDQLANSNRADFMIARIGYTTNAQPLVLDKKFIQNYNSAKAKGIPLGTYVYTYADTLQEVDTQTRAMVQYIKNNNLSFELPIFFDIEDGAYQGKLSKGLKTDMCNTFCNILRNNGLKPGIYSMKSWIEDQIYMGSIPSDVAIWVASYGATTNNGGIVPADRYKYLGNHDIWQFTSVGTIEGVSGNVDVNIAYKRMW